ncbi:MAG: phosphoenolpyruvate synthase [Planctomycetes bacterium]|nr:phosphoenolpyruvate synthase [Planctomycetota bacterium]
MTQVQATQYIRRFEEISIADVPVVGGKNASLGEMYRELTSKGVRVPDGFALTADAYRHFLRESGLDEAIPRVLAGLDTQNIEDLQRRGRRVRDMVLAASIPADLRGIIVKEYDRLGRETGGQADVAVRSSATTEDLPGASFAGQQETFLHVRGHEMLLDVCRRCFASLFTDRAISYRHDQGFEDAQVALSIGVQRMVRSDLASSGVMFTIDTETGFRDVVLINAAYGLGENIVQGSINPDEFYVFKPTLKQGFRPILHKVLGTKELKLIYDVGATKMTRNVPVPPEDRARFAASDDEVLQLSRWACLIEEHYSAKAGHPQPMDIEWAKDGLTGEVFIIQARPETVQSQKRIDQLETYTLKGKSRVLVTGRSVGGKIGSGKAHVIKSAADLNQFRDGEVLVTDKTDPDWEPTMKRAAGIVTNRGGRTCHAAIISREMGLPAIVGTEHGTESIRDGQEVTVCCAGGEVGSVYEGLLPFDAKKIDLGRIDRPRTKIMMNVGNPEEAFRLSMLPNDGVGLAREEFIISGYIRIHPKALIDYHQLKNPAVKAEIDRLTAGYDDKPGFFVDKLAQGVAMIAAAFYPRDVIVRLSDFKTNEYADLLGGKAYEPVEENPMLGFRGASRYYHPAYRDAFALECRAMKKVRDDMGLTNLKIMVPFCRTVEEGRRVVAEMAQNGLTRGENGLELYVMCEIPSNVICAREFAEVFDGFSIGSNDLTQLILGVDRDSQVVAPLFDERNPAVMRMIAQVIQVAKETGRKIGICGQAPSDYPDFARFLVEQGIDSISLNPDAVLATTLKVLETERSGR